MKKNKILFVEDSDEQREPIARMLSDEFDVLAVVDAESALEAARETGPFAVLLSDYDLPGMKGTDLLHAVTLLAPETVGVMMTGLADLDVAIQALHRGRVFRFLSKPCPIDSLQSALRDAVARHHQIVEDKRFAEELLFSKESLASFTAVLEERINHQTAALSRMHEFAVQLNNAQSLDDIVGLTCATAHEILGRRGVHVQVWDRLSSEFGVERSQGPEMSAQIYEQPLLTFEGRIGQISVDTLDSSGTRLSENDRRLLTSIASSAAVAAHNEFRRRERDEAQHATIIALARLSEQRDNETGKHLERVASYCKLVAEGLRQDGHHTDVITDVWIHDLVRSSPLHDIGKVGIPDSILLKPGKLTPKEWEIMKTHAEIGAVTLDSVIQENGHQGFLEMGRDIAWCHHEKWDGTGYPRGLSGADIPLAARILALADVYDALTTVRPYKQAWEHDDAVDWIRVRGGSQFDPEVVTSFMVRQEEAREICERLADRGEELGEALRDATPVRAG